MQPNQGVSAEDFKNRLEAMPEGQRVQMVQMLKLLSAPPETLLALFTRLGLDWEKRGDEMVIKWDDFLKAEATNQEQGPIMKRLITEEFGDVASQKQIGQVVRDMRPTVFQAPEA